MANQAGLILYTLLLLISTAKHGHLRSRSIPTPALKASVISGLLCYTLVNYKDSDSLAGDNNEPRSLSPQLTPFPGLPGLLQPISPGPGFGVYPTLGPAELLDSASSRLLRVDRTMKRVHILVSKCQAFGVQARHPSLASRVSPIDEGGQDIALKGYAPMQILESLEKGGSISHELSRPGFKLYWSHRHMAFVCQVVLISCTTLPP